VRRVLITGGSRGIGAAMTRRFAAAGDRVYFTWNRSEAAAAKLSAETGALGIRADSADGEQVARAVREAEGDRGALDRLSGHRAGAVPGHPPAGVLSAAAHFGLRLGRKNSHHPL